MANRTHTNSGFFFRSFRGLATRFDGQKEKSNMSPQPPTTKTATCRDWVPRRALLETLALILTTLLTVSAVAQEAARVQAIAELLPALPRGVGATINERDKWEALAAHPAFAGCIKQAAKLLDTPIPEAPDELYLEYSTTGNRTHWQSVVGQRHSRVGELVLAECLENQGRFLPGDRRIATGGLRAKVLAAARS